MSRYKVGDKVRIRSYKELKDDYCHLQERNRKVTDERILYYPARNKENKNGYITSLGRL